MATIIGGIGSSHAPTIGVAYDRGATERSQLGTVVHRL
jgi:hypothetical protein